MKLGVIIPALNEEKTIKEVIGRIPGSIEHISEIQILVVDDGSTDNTAEYAKSAGAHVISHGHNYGIGKAFRTGYQYLLQQSTDVIVNIDADGQFAPEDIPKIIKPILENTADFVTASRFKDHELIPDMPPIKRWGNRQLAIVISWLTRQKLHDVTCGFRAYGREAILSLNLFQRFTYTQEMILDLAFKNLRIHEMPMKIRGEREFGKSRIANNLWKYGFNTFKILFKTVKNYHPLRFFAVLSLFSFIPALILLIFSFWHFSIAGAFTPFKWVVFTGGSLLFLSVVFAIAGLLGDNLAVTRLNQERILYEQKYRNYYR